MGTVESLPMFGLDCMNYLKQCILVSDVSISQIYLSGGEKSLRVFWAVFLST